MQQLSLPMPDMVNKTFARTTVSKFGIEQIVLDRGKENTCVSLLRYDQNLKQIGNFPLYCVPKKETNILVGEEMAYSPDSTKVIIVHLNFQDHGLKQVLHYFVFKTEDWTLIHKGSFVSPKAGAVFSRSELLVSNDGSFIQLNRLQRTLAELKSGLKNEYVINVIKPDGTSKEYVIPKSELYTTVKLFNESSGKVFLAAFKMAIRMKTVQFGLDLVVNEWNVLSDTLLAKGSWEMEGLFPDSNPNKSSKNDEQFNPYTLRTFNENADGSYTVTAEQVGRYTETTNIHGKIALVHGYADGTNKVFTLPRSKTSGDNVPYLVGNKNKNWFVLYDDEVSTVPTTTWDEYLKSKPTTNFSNKDQGLILWKIDEQGNTTKALLYGYSDGSPAPDLYRSRIRTNGSILLVSKNQLGWLMLQTD